MQEFGLPIFPPFNFLRVYLFNAFFALCERFMLACLESRSPDFLILKSRDHNLHIIFDTDGGINIGSAGLSYQRPWQWSWFRIYEKFCFVSRGNQGACKAPIQGWINTVFHRDETVLTELFFNDYRTVGLYTIIITPRIKSCRMVGNFISDSKLTFFGEI